MKLTQNQLSDLRDLFVDRYVDNMDTKDLVQYVMDDLDRYYEKQSDMDFLEDAYNYWEDQFDDVVEEIYEYTSCKFKKDRREEDTFIDINNTGGKY